MPESSGLSILGVGVRALAQSAFRAQLSVTCIDCFTDIDTVEASVRCIRAESDDADALADAAIRSADSGHRSNLIVGGGLDARADILHRLGPAFRIQGNGPETAAILADPSRFFGLLDRLDIGYPAVRERIPETPGDWLLKRTDSCGGQGVIPAGLALDLYPAPNSYFQRRISGPALSVLFVANGRDAQIIGYSRLFSEQIGDNPYRYAGAIGWVGVDRALEETLSRWVRHLTHALELRGINGIDLVLRPGDGVPLLLDMNARPTATLELHEDRLAQGGVQCHLDACEGRLPHLRTAHQVRGARVVYARSNLKIPRRPWPAWCSDLPRPGTRIAVGDPLCSVHGYGIESRQVQRLLLERARFIQSSIHDSDAQAA